MTRDASKFTSLDDWLREEGIYDETVAAAKAKIAEENAKCSTPSKPKPNTSKG